MTPQTPISTMVPHPKQNSHGREKYGRAVKLVRVLVQANKHEAFPGDPTPYPLSGQ